MFFIFSKKEIHVACKANNKKAVRDIKNSCYKEGYRPTSEPGCRLDMFVQNDLKTCVHGKDSEDLMVVQVQQHRQL